MIVGHLIRAAALWSAISATACGSDALVECQDADNARVVCGLQNPEDLALVPGTRAVIVSELGSMNEERAGAIAWLDLDSNKVTPLYPQGVIGTEPTKNQGSTTDDSDWGASDCPGPPDRDFNPHGIDLRTRKDGRLELFVVNHAKPDDREAVELFEVIVDADARLSLQWRGCVPTPEGSFLNDVAALPDEGFVVTHMFDRSFGLAGLLRQGLATVQIDTGYVMQWHPGSSVQRVPGTDAPFPNGIAASRDGLEIYENTYMGNGVRRIELATGKLLGTADIAHPDNITWSDDDSLLVASHVGGLSQISACGSIDQGACPAAFEIVSLDPQTMQTKVLVHREGKPMGAATAAIAVDRELIIGSFHADRLIRVQR